MPCATPARVGVVDEGNLRARENGADGAHQALRVKLDVGQEADRAVIGHGTGNVQAAGYDVLRARIVCREDAADALRHRGVGLVAHQGGRGNLALFQKLAGRGEEAGLDARASDVDAKNSFHACVLSTTGGVRGR